MYSQAKSLWLCSLSFFLLSSLLFSSAKKETQGHVADAGGLLRVHSVCLDTTALTKPQLGLLKRVINHAIKPNGVLAKLNWQLLDTCGSADAIVKLNMEERDKESWDDSHRGLYGNDLYDSTVRTQKLAQAEMLITNRASEKTLYLAAGKLRNNAEGAFESVFAKLLNDVEALPH
ncbi:exported hypothetical protein [Acidobacteriia bacterium SbA2]|nr:exported hypothetical protein [Acidobacteriia bacterium SbA2]